MPQKHPIVRMGRRMAADKQAAARKLWEEINERHNAIRQVRMKADDLETWLDIYEESEPGPVRELAVDRLEDLLGIKERDE